MKITGAIQAVTAKQTLIVIFSEILFINQQKIAP